MTRHFVQTVDLGHATTVRFTKHAEHFDLDNVAQESRASRFPLLPREPAAELIDYEAVGKSTGFNRFFQSVTRNCQHRMPLNN
jgi:hypothetical protein